MLSRRSILMGSAAGLVSGGIVAATATSAEAVDNTWFSAKASSGIDRTEPSSSRSLARTSSSASIPGVSAFFKLTVWLGAVYVDSQGGTAKVNGPLSNNAGRFKWIVVKYPNDTGQLDTRAWVGGIPSGPMKATLTTPQGAEFSRALPTDLKKLMVSENPLSEATLHGVGSYNDTAYWAADDIVGNKVLIAVREGHVGTTTISSQQFKTSGLSLRLGVSGESAQGVLLPAGHRASRDLDTAGFKRLDQNFFVDIKGARKDAVLDLPVSPGSPPLQVVTFG